jgi:hypothetical protein
MLAAAEAFQRHSIENDLRRRFAGRVPEAAICAEFTAAHDQFRDARIRTLFAVLVQRADAAPLRGLATHASSS